MVKKFLHTSDWHFGACRRLTPKSSEYLDRHVQNLNKILKLAKKEKVSFALVSGDLFENSGTTLDELLAAYQVFSDFGQICPVIATAGNHDELQIGEFQTKYLELLNIENVTFVSKPTSIDMGLGAKVLAFPWTGIKEQSAFDDFTKSHYQGEEIVMLHECFNGITTDTGYQAKGGVQVPNIEGVKYFACGDIHKMQRLNLEHAWYSGAPMQYNYGDKPHKGVLIVEYSEAEYVPKFIPIPSHIELRQVSSLDQIEKESSHWYQLKTPANLVPRHAPECVKSIMPLAPKIDIPIEMSKIKVEGDLSSKSLAIDYTNGVEELLTQAGYETLEIQIVKEEIQKVSTL